MEYLWIYRGELRGLDWDSVIRMTHPHELLETLNSEIDTTRFGITQSSHGQMPTDSFRAKVDTILVTFSSCPTPSRSPSTT